MEEVVTRRRAFLLSAVKQGKQGIVTKLAQLSLNAVAVTVIKPAVRDQAVVEETVFKMVLSSRAAMEEIAARRIARVLPAMEGIVTKPAQTSPPALAEDVPVNLFL